MFAPESVLPARRALVAFVTFALALAALTPLATPRPTRAATTVFINEFHYDNDGTDVGEFVEIAAPAGTSLTGWSIVLYDGEQRTDVRHRRAVRHGPEPAERVRDVRALRTR